MQWFTAEAQRAAEYFLMQQKSNALTLFDVIVIFSAAHCASAVKCILFPGSQDHTHYGQRNNAITCVDQKQRE
jgi:hypothetical protein